MIEKDLKGKSIEEIEYIIKKISAEKYRAKQIMEWLYKKNSTNINEFLNLPKLIRHKLENEYYITDLKVIKKEVSTIDRTAKLLFLLDDNNVVEGVLMKYKYGYSACISSQIGCKMGCKFCASSINGYIRNLSVSELTDQIIKFNLHLEKENENLSNIVIMGIGEPLDNYDNIVKFIKLIGNKNSLNFSPRRITVSTCGIVPKIYDLSNERLPLTLSISLHASNNRIRDLIMPINKVYPIEELINASKTYQLKTNRRITFEYALIENLNDSKKDAKELSELAQYIDCHVNLIPLNNIKESNLKRPEYSTIKFFRDFLSQQGIKVTIRSEKGKDIEGACGQLRNRYLEEKNKR